MAPWDKERRPWLHGMISLFLGFVILWASLSMPRLHNAMVDGVNGVLFFLEKPSVRLRTIVSVSSNWVLERASLHERVEQLEMKNQALSEALQRASVKVPAERASYIKAAVALRYAGDWWTEICVDKGSTSGVAQGAAATSDGYLVGRVTRVGDSYSWVELITSPTFLIAAVVDETRDLGVVNGDGKGNLRLLFIPEEREVKRGMKISTSLMSDLIPAGVPIGVVLAENQRDDGAQALRVQAGAHLTQLYSVHIFVGRKK